MANYNLYKNIDPSSLSSAASSAKQKLSTHKTKLTTYNSSLNDSIWKAPAKATIKEAFGKIDSEVYTDLDTNLGKLTQIASQIEKYNTARDKALAYKGYLDSATKDTPSSSIDSWKRGLSEQEGIMDSCEQAINNLI